MMPIRRGLSPQIPYPLRGVDWSVGMVDNARYTNGFSTTGGRIWDTTGLLWYRDVVVAMVLAHEIRYVIARHIEKRNMNWVLAGFLANFAGELLNTPSGVAKAATQSALWSLFMWAMVPQSRVRGR